MTVNVERRGEVVVATMDDGKANALTFEAVDELRQAVAHAVDVGRPLVLAGRDGRFCAGFDLSVMRSGDRAQVEAILTVGESLYQEIVNAPVPVVVACTGHALAGGALLLLSADHRIGRAGDFKIGLNEVQIGMALPDFAMTMARYRLDPRHLTAATCFAEVGTPSRAVEVGYLDELADDPIEAAVSLAARLAGLRPEAFTATKRRLRALLSAELASLGPIDLEVLPPAG